jgi:hypothetical protein
MARARLLCMLKAARPACQAGSALAGAKGAGPRACWQTLAQMVPAAWPAPRQREGGQLSSPSMREAWPHTDRQVQHVHSSMPWVSLLEARAPGARACSMRARPAKGSRRMR